MTTTIVKRLMREADMSFHLGSDHEKVIRQLTNFYELTIHEERERCCSIIYGQCESDNVAQRTVNAIRNNK